MKTRSRQLCTVAITWFCFGFIASALSADGGAVPAAVPAVDARSVAQNSAVKPSLSEVREELLELAFQTASAIPTKPHVKDRSRAQEAVVRACVQLDQPARAARYADAIEDWRRGTAYADLALYFARLEQPESARRFAGMAGGVADGATEWRRARILIGIAKTHAVLGDTREAAEVESRVAASERGKVDRARAMVGNEREFDAQLGEVTAVVASGNFDLIRDKLEACTELHDRFYDSTARRTLVETTIKSSWDKLPLLVRVELLQSLAQAALRHQDQASALRLVNDASAIVGTTEWIKEDGIVLKARLAGLRARAGERVDARAALNALLASYDADRSKIVDIYRAGCLRAIAEAYQDAGDSVASLATYRRAIEEAIVNPNSRPRAEDLSATCISMALGDVQLDSTMRSRLHELSGGLGSPW
ncbi:MAG: hypothetical protein SGJ09_00545 [Phycisphaerae bacterium]|nr:hypothetical protein [Phycisphaerae bacterium]